MVRDRMSNSIAKHTLSRKKMIENESHGVKDRLSIYMGENFREWVDTYSNENERSSSSTIRQAIKEFAERQGWPVPGTFVAKQRKKQGAGHSWRK